MNLKKKNAILKLSGSRYKNEESYKTELPPIETKVDTLNHLVFSPNIFGWPANDLQVQNQTTNSEVKIALERRNMKMPAPGSSDNDDVILDTLKKNEETEDEYFDRMSRVIDEADKSRKKSNK